jgi:hypothetical protein
MGAPRLIQSHAATHQERVGRGALKVAGAHTLPAGRVKGFDYRETGGNRLRCVRRKKKGQRRCCQPKRRGIATGAAGVIEVPGAHG